MNTSDLTKLVKVHFDLIEEEQVLRRAINDNKEQMAKALANAGFFDLLEVNWDRAYQELTSNV